MLKGSIDSVSSQLVTLFILFLFLVVVFQLTGRFLMSLWSLKQAIPNWSLTTVQFLFFRSLLNFLSVSSIINFLTTFCPILFCTKTSLVFVLAVPFKRHSLQLPPIGIPLWIPTLMLLHFFRPVQSLWFDSPQRLFATYRCAWSSLKVVFQLLFQSPTACCPWQSVFSFD